MDNYRAQQTTALSSLVLNAKPYKDAAALSQNDKSYKPNTGAAELGINAYVAFEIHKLESYRSALFSEGISNNLKEISDVLDSFITTGSGGYDDRRRIIDVVRSISNKELFGDEIVDKLTKASPAIQGLDDHSIIDSYYKLKNLIGNLERALKAQTKKASVKHADLNRTDEGAHKLTSKNIEALNNLRRGPRANSDQIKDCLRWLLNVRTSSDDGGAILMKTPEQGARNLPAAGVKRARSDERPEASGSEGEGPQAKRAKLDSATREISLDAGSRAERSDRRARTISR